MVGLPEVTVVGILVADPELGVTPTGAAVATFTVARRQDREGLPDHRTARVDDAWDRYLPPRHPSAIGNSGNCGNPAGQAVTDRNPVTDGSVTALLPVTDPSVTADPSVTP